LIFTQLLNLVAIIFLQIFSENAKGIMDRYSREFESMYLTTLRQRHTTKRVNANNVYQEVIQDKQHIHMNSTRWATLSDFVMYLGKTGKCVVDETERGWYVQYIENDASILERKRRQEQRAESEKIAEIAQAERMERQRIEAAKALDRAGGTVHLEATKLERKDDDKAITVALKTNTVSTKKKPAASAAKLGFFEEGDDEEEDEKERKVPAINLPPPPPPLDNRKRPKKDSENINPEESKRPKKEPDAQDSDKKQSAKEKDIEDEEVPWLKRDIIVRIINKKLKDGKYFRKKAIVDEVLKDNKFSAEVAVLDDDGKEGDILRLDQKDLETVIPKEGKKVRLLKGKYRGQKAKLVSADKKKYRATLKLVDDGEILEKVDFEDFSQLA
jgi:DNA/RNA-binding protein KIN17